MNKRVLLLSPPYHSDYMRNARCDFFSLSATQWYPIWLGYCGALLEKYGFQVKLIDALTYKLSFSKVTNMVEKFDPFLIAVYSSRISKMSDIEYADFLVSEYRKKVVFVGPFVSINPAEYLNFSSKVRLAVRGEFEFPLVELAEGLPEKDIKNLVRKERGGDVIENPLRPYLTQKELDEIPFVSDFFYRHLNIKKYKAPSELHPYIDIMTGRGCVWGLCTFCLWVHSFIKGAVYNTRSIGNVLDELEYISRNIPAKSIMIQDDTFPEDRAVLLSQGILDRDLNITWSCYARPNMSFDALKLMKEAGCRNLHVGYETSSDAVLKKIGKGIKFEDMVRFTEDAKRAGLNIHADFAMGFPGETEESLKETIEWACKLDPYTAQFQLIIPYPSTPFYNQLEREGNLNAEGQPDYPHLSNERIRQIAKIAYRKFYFRREYLLRTIKHPYDRIVKRIPTFLKAIPAMFWKKWKV